MAPEIYDRVIERDLSESLIENNLRVVQALGYSKELVEPQVSYSPGDLAETEALLQETGAAPGRPRFVFITQTSPTQRKSWPQDRFVSVAHHVANAYRANIIFVGTAKEAAGIESIRAELQVPSTSLAGKTSIPVLAALLSVCDFAVTLDTGNMHIARSVGLPMVILAPAWQPVVEWLPLGFDQYRIFKGDDIPEAPPDYVMTEISTSEVLAGLDELCTRYPASKEARTARVQRSLSLSSPK
jgi:ADP-heptose:LPS heptosyltransferase